MPAVHRNTDNRVCGAKTTVTGQNTVYANGLLIAVQGDPNTHGAGGLSASVNPGTVFINGKEMVVQGSSASPDALCPVLGPPHCGPTATSGSPDVFAFDGGSAGPAGGGGGLGAAEAATPGDQDESDPTGDELNPAAGDDATDLDAPTDDPNVSDPDTSDPVDPAEVAPGVEERIEAITNDPSEQATIADAVAQANAETGLDWVPVTDPTTGETFLATSDYLRDADGNYIRTGGDGAQTLANQFGSQLPSTATQVDAIHQAATVTPPFVPAGVPAAGNTQALINQHNQILNGFTTDPGSNGGISSGHLKTITTGGAIYHGIWPDGRTVQGLGVFHSGSYVDYSQGVRLIRPL